MEEKIFIGIPAYGGVSSLTMGTVIHIIGNAGRPVKLSLFPDCALVTLARSELLGRFLQSDCSHFLFLDADISFDPELFKRMLGANRDVVVVAYSNRHPPFDCKVNGIEPFHVIEGDNGEKLVEIHSTGLGCCLVTRKALEETCKKYSELKYESNNGFQTYALFLEALRHSPQDNVLRFMGEDIMFFWRLREAGFPAFAMLNAQIDHAGHTFSLSEVITEEKLKESAERVKKLTKKLTKKPAKKTSKKK